MNTLNKFSFTEICLSVRPVTNVKNTKKTKDKTENKLSNKRKEKTFSQDDYLR